MATRVALSPSPSVAPELPPLLVEIRQHGVPVKIVELDDPRVAFCESYNDLTRGTGSGRTAHPVAEGGER